MIAQNVEWGWGAHRYINENAVDYLPSEMSFFQDHRQYLKDHSVDPDTNPIKEDHVRANLYCGQMILRPKDIGQTEVELTLFVHPRGRIPTWLFNMAQKSLPYDFLRALEEKASGTSYKLRPSFKEMLDQLISLLRN